MTATGLMAAPFPEPPGVIARLLDELRLAAAATDETEHESRRVAMLSRASREAWWFSKLSAVAMQLTLLRASWRRQRQPSRRPMT